MKNKRKIRIIKTPCESIDLVIVHPKDRELYQKLENAIHFLFENIEHLKGKEKEEVENALIKANPLWFESLKRTKSQRVKHARGKSRG